MAGRFGSLFKGVADEALEQTAKPLLKTEEILKAGKASPADPLASRQDAGTVMGSVDESLDAPAPHRTPERNINIDRLNTSDEVDNLLNAVSESSNNAGYRPVTFEEMNIKVEGLDDAAVLKTIINPKRNINKDGLLSGPQLKKARDIMVTSAVNIAERAKDIAVRAARNEVGDIELVDFQRQVYRHQAVQSAVQNEIRETARSLSFLREVSGPMNSLQLEQMMISHGGGRDAILAKAKAITAAGAGKEGAEAILAVNKAMKDTWWMRTANQIVGYRTVQLLSSPRTHVRNIVGNAITNVLAPLERGFGALYSQSFGSGEIVLGEMAQMYRADVSAFGDAMSMANKTMKSKESAYGGPKVDEQLTFGQVPDESVKHGSVFMQGIDYLSKALSLPGNALLAEDEFFKTLAFRQQMQSLAYRQARREGLATAKEIDERVAEIISGPNQEKILEKVKQGYLVEDDADLTAEFMGRLNAEEKMFYDMYKESADFAQYQTFTDPAVTKGGKALEVAMRNPIAKMIVPFYRTPANIFMYAAERSPLAFISPQWWRDMAAGGARRDMASARWALGSSTALFFSYLAWSGNVTGSGPGNPSLRISYENGGWRRNSVRIPGTDKWVSYQGLDPFSTQLSTIANIFDAYRYAETDKQREHIAMIATGAMFESLKERSFLEGLAGFVDALKSSETGTISHFFSSLPASFVPYSSALRTLNQSLDPVKRNTIANDHWERVLNEVQKIIPLWSQSLPPRVMPFGEVQQYDDPAGPDLASPFFMPSEVKDVGIASAVAMNSVPIPRVYPIFTFAGVKIDSLDLEHKNGPGWAYFDMQQMVGEEQAKMLKVLITKSQYKKLPDGAPTDQGSTNVTKGDKLREMMQKGRQAGMARFFKKYEEQLAAMTKGGEFQPRDYSPSPPKMIQKPPSF